MSYRPFIDPLPFHDLWYLLLLPMALGVAIVYRAVRTHTLVGYWRQVFVMTVQIIAGMIILGIGSYLLFAVYVRFIAEKMAGG